MQTFEVRLQLLICEVEHWLRGKEQDGVGKSIGILLRDDARYMITSHQRLLLLCLLCKLLLTITRVPSDGRLTAMIGWCFGGNRISAPITLP